MNDFHFVMVSFDASSRRDVQDITKQLNRANDWIEFRKHTWLVWTKQSSKIWYQRLKPLLQDGENIFVCAVDINNRAGWMPKGFWEFIRSKQP